MYTSEKKSRYDIFTNVVLGLWYWDDDGSEDAELSSKKINMIIRVDDQNGTIIGI